jgi:hypothetical protein
MPYQLMGGSAAANDYDYQSGSGMDSFMSRSIDEVSWQSSLGTQYNTLQELPIGVYPTTSTPTNYDLTAISGSQSGTTTIGGASGGGGASSAGGLAINATDQNITLSDGITNRLLLGKDVGGF